MFLILLLMSLIAWQTSLGQTPAPAGGPLKSTYVLGPDDEFTIKAMDADELSGAPYRVDSHGNVRLAIIGSVHCAGLTVEELERQIGQRLGKYIQDPQVSIHISELRSRPISVVGAVKNPGVHQLQGDGTLVEMISLAGGLLPEAGNQVRITRRLEYGRIPLAGAADDETGKYSVADVGVKKLMDARDPAVNIPVKPNDVISVPRADTVYVLGQVKKAGGFPMKEHEQVTTLQALSFAEGMDSTAAPRKAEILRVNPGSPNRKTIPVNLTSILHGKDSDVVMQPDDILYVPNNAPKSAALRGTEAAIQIATGIVIWRR